MTGESESGDVDSVIITDDLDRRPSRAPDYEAESRALASLAAEMSSSPATVLQRLVETAMDLTHADSAGISLLEPGGEHGIFRWVAASGAWAPYRGGTMPREASPCGEVMAQDATLLMSEPGRAFPALLQAEPGIHEGLLAPFVIDGAPAGTVWVVKHGPEGRFEAEDARILESLTGFASAAHQMVLALRSVEADRRADQARTDAALSESQRAYSMLVETIDDGFCRLEVLFDPQGRPCDCRFLEVNAAFARQTGLADAAGRTARELVPNYPQHWLDIFGRIVRRGRAERFEEEQQALGRFYEVQATPVGTPDQHQLAVLFRDVLPRRRMEAALRESEARFRALGTAGAHMVYRMSPDWRHMYQLSGRDFLADTDAPIEDWMESYLLPEDRPTILAAVERAIRTKSLFDLEHRVRRADGGVGWVHSRAVPILGADGEIVEWFGAGADIDARKSAEAALRESREQQAFILRFSDALRPLTDPVAIQEVAVDMLGAALQVDRCYYIETDRARQVVVVTREYLGAGSHSLVGEHPLETFETLIDLGAAGDPLICDDISAHPVLSPEADAYRKRGVQAFVVVPLVRNDLTAAFMCLTMDQPRTWTEAEVQLLWQVAERTWAAVERARAEEALREREAELARTQRIGQIASVEVLLTNPPLGHRSPEYRRLHGLPPDRAVETHQQWLARLHPDDREREDREFSAAIASGDVFESEYRIIRPSDGEKRWISARGLIERDARGEATRLLGAHIDVTERKRADAALRAGEERQAFLLELSDALRPLEDAADIERTAVDMLGRKLGANRVFYATIESDGDTAIVRHAFTDGVASGVGRHSLEAFRPGRVQEWLAGRTTMTVDSEADPTFDDFDRAAYASVSSRAAVGVPLVKRGRLVALLAVDHSAPRVWTEQETGLIVEVAERIWLAVDRARAEAALRETEERLQQFGGASQDVLWIRNAETFQWEYLTPAFETIYGLDRAAALRGDNLASWLELILPEDREHAARSIQRVRDGEGMTFEYRIRRPVDGRMRWLRNTDFPIKDASGKVVRIGGIGHDITPLKETERALAAAEKRQRALVEGIPQLLWRAFDGGHWTWASPQWTEYTGQAEADSHGFGWLDPVHPDDRQAVRDIWQGAIERGEFHAAYRLCNLRQKRYRWFQTRATPVRDDDGRIVEWLGTSTDIDDLRGLQNRQEVLVAELQHRVRNILTVVRSVFTRTAETGDDIDEIADHFKGRLDALARTQVIVTRNAERTVDLEDLVREELLSVAVSDGPNVVIDGPEVKLTAKVAETLGLALHELTTNALKYGALKMPPGRLAIAWNIDARYGGGRVLHLTWVEQGVPAVPVRPIREGFGRELIEEALPYRLGAETRLEFEGGGVRCTISIPLPPEDEVSSADT